MNESSNTIKELENITLEMVKAGDVMAEDLVGAMISYNMDGVGGSKTWEEWQNTFEGTHKDLIVAYVEEQIDSVTAIYIAMERTKNQK